MFRAVKYKLDDVPDLYWDFVQKYGSIYQTKSYLECLAASSQGAFVVAVYEGDTFIGGAAISSGRRLFGFPANSWTYYGPVVVEARLAPDVLKSIVQVTKTCSFKVQLMFPIIQI